jgi:hypothetical protein
MIDLSMHVRDRNSENNNLKKIEKVGEKPRPLGLGTYFK